MEQDGPLMARARLLKPGFFSNETLAELPPFGRLLFAGLWTIADKEGRLPDRPKWIKGAIFPYDNVPVEKHLEQLTERGFILRYTAEGERYIQIVQWQRHQHPHLKEVESTIPAPNEHLPRQVLDTTFSGTSPVISGTRSPDPDPRSGVLYLDPDPDPDPEAAAAADNEDPVLDVCRRLCREVFGSTETIRGKSEAAIRNHGPECVRHCVQESVLSGGASWKYAEKIMTRHSLDGCDEPGITRIDRIIEARR